MNFNQLVPMVQNNYMFICGRRYRIYVHITDYWTVKVLAAALQSYLQRLPAVQLCSSRQLQGSCFANDLQTVCGRRLFREWLTNEKMERLLQIG